MPSNLVPNLSYKTLCRPRRPGTRLAQGRGLRQAAIYVYMYIYIYMFVVCFELIQALSSRIISTHIAIQHSLLQRAAAAANGPEPGPGPDPGPGLGSEHYFF